MAFQVEFSVNDNEMGMKSLVRRSYERLLRKLLNLPHRPSVMLLQTNRNFDDEEPPENPEPHDRYEHCRKLNNVCGFHLDNSETV